MSDAKSDQLQGSGLLPNPQVASPTSETFDAQRHLDFRVANLMKVAAHLYSTELERATLEISIRRRIAEYGPCSAGNEAKVDTAIALWLMNQKIMRLASVETEAMPLSLYLHVAYKGIALLEKLDERLENIREATAVIIDQEAVPAGNKLIAHEVTRHSQHDHAGETIEPERLDSISDENEPIPIVYDKETDLAKDDDLPSGVVEATSEIRATNECMPDSAGSCEGNVEPEVVQSAADCPKQWIGIVALNPQGFPEPIQRGRRYFLVEPKTKFEKEIDLDRFSPAQLQLYPGTRLEWRDFKQETAGEHATPGGRSMSDHLRNTAPMMAAKRCGAQTRRGTPCAAPAISGKHRCRKHGGKNPGPPKGNRNARKHGFYSREFREFLTDYSALLKTAKEILKESPD